MALEILNFLAIFSLVLIAILTLKIWSYMKKTTSTSNIPPGPFKLPIIGNIPHLISSTPHRRLRDLAKKYGPLMYLQLGEVSTIVVSSAEYAKEIMKTHDLNFASRRPLITAEVITYGYLSLAYTPYGDYWRHLRKICHLELLSAKRIQSFVPIIEEEITNLIKFIASQEGSVINFTQASCSSLYTISSKAAFGNKCKDQEGYISAVDDLSKLLGGFFMADLFPSATWLQKLSGMKTKIEKSFEKVDWVLENIISDHRVARSRTEEGQVEAREDLIDILLKFEDGSNMDFRLTNTNIKAIIFVSKDIFTASNETTTTTDWAMAETLKDPRVLNKAQAEVREVFDKTGRVDEAGINELKYLKSIIKETLRLHPPIAMLLPRECGQACEINGYHIPAKSTIIVNAWAIARDPNHWIEPERFYPERFIDSSIDYKGNNFEFIPFGAGRRICPGMNFGVANIELALALLLYHFDWKLPNGMKNEDIDMTEEFGVTVSRKNELYLIPVASRPLLVDTSTLRLVKTTQDQDQ